MRRFALIATVVVVLLIAVDLTGCVRRAANEPQATASPVATPEPNLDAMAAAGVALIRAAQSMEAGVVVLEERANATGDPALADLAQHWRSDAKALRDRGVWLMVSTSADAMVHDPDTAHELNLENLRANGEVMVVDGKAMIEHGKEMIQQVASLRDTGVLSPDLADQLTAAAEGLVTTGKQLERDGNRMRDYAEQMLHSIGQ